MGLYSGTREINYVRMKNAEVKCAATRLERTRNGEQSRTGGYAAEFYKHILSQFTRTKTEESSTRILLLLNQKSTSFYRSNKVTNTTYVVILRSYRNAYTLLSSASF